MQNNSFLLLLSHSARFHSCVGHISSHVNQFFKFHFFFSRSRSFVRNRVPIVSACEYTEALRSLNHRSIPRQCAYFNRFKSIKLAENYEVNWTRSGERTNEQNRRTESKGKRQKQRTQKMGRTKIIGRGREGIAEGCEKIDHIKQIVLNIVKSELGRHGVRIPSRYGIDCVLATDEMRISHKNEICR